MRTTELELHAALERRISDLCGWLESVLEIGELREKRDIRAAKNALLKWICEVWDNNEGDVDGALECALEDYVECGRRWVAEPATLEADFSISAEPAWTIPEFHLIAASMLAEQALIAFQRGTKKGLLLAGMLYADAVEAREHWNTLRGPAGARNPNTLLGEIHGLVRSLDEKIAVEKHRDKVSSDARKENSKKAAKVKLANDRNGTQAAKVTARELWPEANRNGWSAARFHSALTGAGHTVAFDTARKWLTSLRKTGTC